MIEKYAAEYFTPNCDVLEIGPDFNNPVVIPNRCWQTADNTNDPRLTYLWGENGVYSAQVYDVVFAANVVEHVC